MSKLTRRGLIAAAGSLALAGPALAAEKLVPVGKVFPYLDAYLKLPAAERSRFTLAYYLTLKGKPVQGLKIWFVDGGQRTAVGIGPGGRVLRLPTLAQLQGKTQLAIEAPPATKFGIQLAVEPVIRPGVEVDAGQLTQAVIQAAAATKKQAGMLSFVVPKMERVYFTDAAGAQLVFADGRRTPLAVVKKTPVFDPFKVKGAKTIVFAQPPSRMEIGPAS